MQRPHRPYFLIVLAFLVLVLFVLLVGTGSVAIPWRDTISVLTGGETDPALRDIVLQFRLPRAVTGILAGAALASGGLMMQTLFRNPLAGPDVLGLSSGASLLVAIVILAGTGSSSLLVNTTSPWTIAAAASTGSAVVFLIIIAISRRVTNNVSMLIVGLMTATVTSSIVGILQFLSRAEDLQSFVIWTLGTTGSTGWDEIIVLGAAVLAGSVIAMTSIKSLNSILLGENYAHNLGIRIKSARFRIVTSTSILCGSVTAFCGPIAFVGLAVPHLVRMITQTNNHRILLPGVMLVGAALILFCDLVAQWPGTTQILPLNAITSIIGAPVVIWVVLIRKPDQ